MRFSYITAAVTAVLMAASVDALKVFVIGDGGTLVTGRVDPIMSPGEVAGHVHRVIGASTFGPSLNDPDTMLNSKCSSVRVGADKSNYWFPSLYFINKNGTYSLMPHVVKVYYFLPQDDVKYTAFPPGLRMMTGLGGARDPGHIRVQGIEINMDPYKPGTQSYHTMFLPNGTVYPDPPKGDYIHMNLRFPSCGWANQSLDSPDHFSHMTWPLVYDKWNPSGGYCPESHPIAYPEIFIENFVFIDERMKSEWNKTGPNFVLANGDVTGLTLHGDFVAGWDHKVLQEALDTCASTGNDIQQCKPFGDSGITPNDHLNDCRIEGMIPAEEVGLSRALEHLPGCNPLWGWDGPATKPNDCPWYKGPPGWTKPNLLWNEGALYQSPAVVPGVKNVSDIMNKNIGTGRQGQTATFIPWGVDGFMKENVTWAQIGTQEEVDAAAQNAQVGLKEANPKGSWSEISPGKYAVDANRMKEITAKAVKNSEQLRACKYYADYPMLLPCSTDVAPDITSKPDTNKDKSNNRNTQGQSQQQNQKPNQNSNPSPSAPPVQSAATPVSSANQSASPGAAGDIKTANPKQANKQDGKNDNPQQAQCRAQLKQRRSLRKQRRSRIHTS